MKIIVAPNAFKGSLTAFAAADNIEKGIKRVFPRATIIKLPMADGGDGTMEVLAAATGGSIKKLKVTGPLGKKVDSGYVAGKTAVIEMAAAAGLRLLAKRELDPMRATTFGVGELIKDALKSGCKKIVIGIGGSATNEGGSGMCLALGFRLVKKNNMLIGPGGNGLLELDRIENPEHTEKFKNLDITIASDVTNILLGRSGASRMFGPQKGATPEMVLKLETALANYARVIKRDLGVDVNKLKGGGAAGGIGAGLYAFLGAKMNSGINIVIENSGLEKELKKADLVFTGEGQIDDQSLYGKAPIGVARRAKKYGIPVICIAGSIGKVTKKTYEAGITGIISLCKQPMTLEYAMKNSKALIADAAENAARIFRANTFYK
ncbi:MAG: glycerate kinase [Candidatus Firestonebacteria bacterium]